MSAKKSADAALVIAEEALRNVHSLQKGNPLLLLAIIFVLGYIFYVNYYLVKDSSKSNFILQMYHNTNVRIAIISLIVLGMSGIFGFGISRLSTILAFTYVTTYVTLKDLKESMEDGDGNVKKKNNEKENKKIENQLEEQSKEIKKLQEKLDKMKKLHQNDDEKEDLENMENYPLGRDGAYCKPCSNGTQTAFNPRPYETNSPLQGIGNDNLPPMGVDFLSAPPGVYSQSQIAYQFGMS
jgi:DNA-binding transcriptional MerR regulator